MSDPVWDNCCECGSTPPPPDNPTPCGVMARFGWPGVPTPFGDIFNNPSGITYLQQKVTFRLSNSGWNFIEGVQAFQDPFEYGTFTGQVTADAKNGTADPVLIKTIDPRPGTLILDSFVLEVSQPFTLDDCKASVAALLAAVDLDSLAPGQFKTVNYAGYGAVGLNYVTPVEVQNADGTTSVWINVAGSGDPNDPNGPKHIQPNIVITASGGVQGGAGIAYSAYHQTAGWVMQKVKWTPVNNPVCVTDRVGGFALDPLPPGINPGGINQDTGCRMAGNSGANFYLYPVDLATSPHSDVGHTVESDPSFNAHVDNTKFPCCQPNP